jgi:hypothetical protein
MVDPSIGCHFFTPLITCPILSRTHQGFAYALTPEVFVNKPAFDEANGLGWVASVGV